MELRDKIKTDVIYYFCQNFESSFYKVKSKTDHRVYKLKVIGSKMNFNDFETAINIILDKIENDNFNLNNNNINIHNDNIVNNIINNIINFNQSYQNYNPMYLYIKLKDKVKPGSKFSYASFEKKYNTLKNNQNPFYLMLYPNYEWADLIVGFNQIQ